MMQFGTTDWMSNWIRDWSPMASLQKFEINEKGSPIKTYAHVPVTYLVAGLLFACIAVIGILSWSLPTSVTAPPQTTASFSQSVPEALRGACADNPEECQWSHVITDVTNRLQMLELAFKEQVFARETIAREITGQSDTYGNMDRKLSLFLEKLDNMSSNFNDLEMKYQELSSRVYTDEILAVFLVVVMLLGFVFLCRGLPKVQEVIDTVAEYRPFTRSPAAEDKVERRTSSNPGTPKHSPAPRHEVCVIVFQRDSADSAFQNLTDAMARHLDGIRVTQKPYYTVCSQDDIRTIPYVRLYVIIIDIESRGTFLSGSEKDLVLMTVKHTRSLGGPIGQTVVVLANDEGSKKLTAHNMYNTSLRLVKTNGNLQDTAANGRLFSMWKEMTSHQLSHLRRIIKNALNLKTIIR